MPWTNGFSLVIAGIAFCGSHVLLSSTRLRGAWRDQLGERGFIAVYSPTSLVVSFGSWPALRLRRRSCCGRGNDGRHSSRESSTTAFPRPGRWHRALISNRRHHEIDRACFGRQRLREPAETNSAAEESGFGPSNGYRSARAAEQRLRASPRRARTQPTPSVRSSLS